MHIVATARRETSHVIGAAGCPRSRLVVHDFEQYLFRRPPRVVARRAHARRRVEEDERAASFWTRGGEEERKWTAFGEAEDGGLLGTGVVHHRAHVGDLSLEIGKTIERSRIRQ